MHLCTPEVNEYLTGRSAPDPLPRRDSLQNHLPTVKGPYLTCVSVGNSMRGPGCRFSGWSIAREVVEEGIHQELG